MSLLMPFVLCTAVRFSRGQASQKLFWTLLVVAPSKNGHRTPEEQHEVFSSHPEFGAVSSLVPINPSKNKALLKS